MSSWFEGQWGGWVNKMSDFETSIIETFLFPGNSQHYQGFIVAMTTEGNVVILNQTKIPQSITLQILVVQQMMSFCQ